MGGMNRSVGGANGKMSSGRRGTDTNAKDNIQKENRIKNLQKNENTNYFSNVVVEKSSSADRLKSSIKYLVPMFGFIVFAIIVVILVNYYNTNFYSANG